MRRHDCECGGFRSVWSAAIEFGAIAKEGNKDQLQFRGRADLKRTTDVDLLRFYISGELAEQNDIRSSSEVKGGAAYEYTLTERWFAFAKTELEYDEFENLDLRATASVGGGYYFLKEEKYELRGRTGVGYLHESFSDGVVEDTATLELGIDFRLDILEWLRFTNASTYYPTFDGIDDYRLVFDNALVIPITPDERWNLKFGALFEYDSMPRPGIERLDQTYYANVLLNVD